MLPLLLSLLIAAPARADTCPAYRLDRASAAPLHEALRVAPDPQTAQEAMLGLWKIWSAAPDAQAQEWLDSARERINLSDFDAALRMLGMLIEYCPDFAEGYNQRAFANFLKDDFSAALEDLDRTLAIIPDHIGAMAGRGLALMRLGRDREALEAFEAAMELNPWLSERGLVPGLKQKLGIKDL